MKALIFNSGLGIRLGSFVVDKPKCMVQLGSGETVFHRQLRILHACGITEFVVTTGPYAEQLKAEAAPFAEAGCSFEFVWNPRFAETNYIYSMWLAREVLRGDDFLILHGDLVFDAAYVQAVVDSDLPSLGSVNPALDLPEKDFKARIVDGEVREVSVKIFDDDCVAFQAFYKLSEASLGVWMAAVDRFVDAGETGVYAENAANTVFEDMHVAAFSYEGHFVDEIDTPDDLVRVSAGIRLHDFAQQPVYRMVGDNARMIAGLEAGAFRVVAKVGDLLSSLGMGHPLVVTAPFFNSLDIARTLDALGVPYTLFTDFESNPTFEDIVHALRAYRDASCDSLLSVGGGSAIDIAKCVKQLLALPEDPSGQAFKRGNLPYSDVPHIAVPTVAGSGSESTHFAVCYIDGEKVSVANDCLQPNAVLLDVSNVAGVPDYQKKSALLDALCQAIESYWSRRSCIQSRVYSAEAIPTIMCNAKAHLKGDSKASWEIMRAANLAGKAINLTTTTAPHAMSYMMTLMYGIPHGHAVALCMPHCWNALLDVGENELGLRLRDIAALVTMLEDAAATDGLEAFERFYDDLCMPDDWKPGNCDDADTLEAAVNIQRLSNFPITLSEDAIRSMYRGIVV